LIYFMQPTDGGPVKIGFTDNLPTRHKQLEAHYGRPLAILATMDGDLDTEREIQARFSHLCLGRTEQFRPGPDLMEFIGHPVVADHGAVKEMPCTEAFMDRAIVGKAKMIATHRGISVAELLSDAAKPIIDKAYAQMLRELEAAPK
jgi:hypothetical protein